ncbi:MAG: hypothetical protein HFG57_07230 [Lachnospiraceae bacterium]|nr:hypothetical protein [Lachnospiraceae bacterium]
MKSSNGFNKKQKQEIREIVKSEISNTIRKNANPDLKVKDETIEAINSVLNEKNDDLIKNLLEIENKIIQEETKNSSFAANIKGGLYVFCYIAWTLWVLIVVATVYVCYNNGSVINNFYSMIVLFIVYFLLALFLFIFSKSLKRMSKNDLYNSFMFIITMISFIITISTVI